VDDDGKPLVTLHDLRRTCGSLMLAKGFSLIAVSRHLGNANPNVTARVYAHLLGDEQLAALPAAFEAVNAPPATSPQHSRRI
jgi:integrase